MQNSQFFYHELVIIHQNELSASSLITEVMHTAATVALCQYYTDVWLQIKTTKDTLLSTNSCGQAATSKGLGLSASLWQIPQEKV